MMREILLCQSQVVKICTRNNNKIDRLLKMIVSLIV